MKLSMYLLAYLPNVSLDHLGHSTKRDVWAEPITFGLRENALTTEPPAQ